ncbi:DgyrCDS137 [Dimorphilus gyrociliatus]|uniref:DgyrCDS137 n=1 Tax=Dimorphilus gyrociliatus TaxID=2664684 RepID=A0A7I8V3X6_9ANNE|nr:DgyrCDS137 [Dimorphilus gyrociliatus]
MYRLLVLILSVLTIKSQIAVKDVTKKAFGNIESATIAAFGDINADRFTDILVITSEGRIDVLLSNKKEGFSRSTFLKGSSTSEIYGIIPTDFNGDGQMDVLVTYKAGKKLFNAGVHFGIPGETSVEPHIHWLTVDSNLADLKDEPFLFDVNFDMYPDLLAETKNDRIIWKIDKPLNNNFTATIKNRTEHRLIVPHSSAFLDLGHDSSADYVLTTVNKDDIPVFEYYLSGKEEPQEITADIKGAKVYGQSSFTDLNQNTFANHILPVCMDYECKDSQIWVYLNETIGKQKWFRASEPFYNKHNKATWGFNNNKYGIKLRMGDFDSDGYQDALVVLKRVDENESQYVESRAFILYNRKCSKAFCQKLERYFDVDWSSGTSENVTLATFFDYQEDGKLDILVQTDTGLKNGSRLKLYESKLDADVCFMKVLVTNGLCYKNCANDRPPYGVNVPGPAIRYDTVNINNRRQKSFGGQLSQSAHRALQLPYVHFGLGQTPNFLDKLVVSIPSNLKRKEKVLTTVIPNSRIIIIPYPLDKPSSWTDKLFVNPGIKVLITGGSLLGTCIFVAIIVGLLHWKERSDDKKEKRQDAHKFHFDAM